MVIDYLPRIPRIPYSDRPHGPKIEPSITGAPHSLSLFSLPSPSSTSVHGSPPPPSLSSIFFQGARTRNFERPGKRVALIKRAQIWHLLGTSKNSGIFLFLLRIRASMPFDISGKFEFRVENEDFSIFFSSFVQRSEKLFDYYFSIFLFIQFVNPILIIKS